MRRLTYFLLVGIVVAGGALLWVRHGWLDEQRRLADLRQHLGARPQDLDARSEPLSRWLRARLPDRIGVYLDRVTALDVYSTDTTDDDLRAIGGITHLRELMLQGPHMTDAGFAHLKSLDHMRKLHLMCRQITDAGLANVGGMRRMQELTIEGGRVTNAGLQHVDGMPDLRWLTICRNAVNRDGLRQWMRRHPGVQVVDGPEGPIKADE